MKLKTTLLNTDLVVDNSYLDKYVEIVENNRQQSKVKFETDAHHIIPAFYYRSYNQPVDNSDTNLVILYNKDHILAHMYLALCVTDRYKDAAARAVSRVVTGHEGGYSNIMEAIDLLDFNKLQQIHKQTRIATSKLAAKIKPNKGMMWINNGVKNKMIPPEDFDTYSLSGYVKGRLPLPQDGIEKMRITRTGQKYSPESAKRKRENATATMLERYGVKGINTSTPEKKTKIQATVNKYYETHFQCNKGKICIHNVLTGQIKYITEDQLDEMLANGWSRGRK